MHTRSLALVAMILSLVALVLSVGAMARRVSAYYQTSARSPWMFEPLDMREFRFAGRDVAIADAVDADGTAAVVVRYGEEELRLRATMEPLPPEVPGLARHRDWLKVLRFADTGALPMLEAAEKVERGELADRLAIVVKRLPTGVDPAALGHAGRRKWRFDFYELRAEGGFAAQRDAGLPEREKDRRRRVAEAAEKGLPDLGPPARTMVAGSWEADAAMMMMPTEPLFSAAYSPVPRQALGPVRAMNWTLPSAAFSGLAVVASFVALTSVRRRSVAPAA